MEALAELKRSQELLSFYKEALDAAALVFITDSSGTILFVNEMFCRTMGYSQEELLGANPRLFSSATKSREWYAEMWAQIKRGEVRKHEICDRTKAGRPIWLDVTIVSLRSAVGEPMQFMSVSFDISARKQLECELVAARERALAAAREESQFIAHASHEIRTPMNALLGITDLLLGTPLSSQQQEFVSLMNVSGKILLALINDILDFSKMKAGGLTLEARPVALRELVSNVISLYALTAVNKGVTLREVVDPSLPSHLVGDFLRLTQVLSNLIANALKFTPQGEVVVSVQKKSLCERCFTVEFVVKDSGIGMSDAQLAQLFVPFVQADVSVARTHGGTGLGLTICKELVELMGGELTVRSVAQVGSEFYFSIEMFAVDSKNSDIAPRATRIEQSLSLFPAELRQRSIAVAEDNAVNRKLIDAALRRMGFEPLMAENGKELLELMETTRVDLVLMDSQMPVMNGSEAASAIAARCGAARPPIVLVTASVSAHSTGEYDAGLFDGILVKPIDFSALREMLLRVLSSASVEESEGVPAAIEQSIDSRIALLRQELGDDAVVVQILEAFLSSSTATVNTLLALKWDDDAEKKERAAHALAGSAWNVGAAELATYLESLEAAAKSSPAEWKRNFDSLKLERLLEVTHKKIGELIATFRSKNT